MQCPLCRTLDTGRVGSNQYYCWQCLLEFKQNNRQARMFYVEEDGTLVPVSIGPETS